ncbi:MAG: ribonuclease HII, partial [Elusimicrobia bacterium]|nr:ribonuclease HII [Elusimicrobiota bacterium]MBD3412666.1 ribonuclease HII [Elusimicrobiota bacterium]
MLAGVDEAGRGPLAGPVVAAAVIMPCDQQCAQINDSKMISGSLRTKLYQWIIAHCIDYSVSVVDHVLIDTINILQASLKAMHNAMCSLHTTADLYLIDGTQIVTDSRFVQRAVVRGDQKSFSIACASIIAKVVRDRIMHQLHARFPAWDFAAHKGYPTAA